MENYANHGFILLIPIFLMSLGFIIAFFWTRQRQYLSVLWLAFALLSAGAVMLAQSLISPTHLHQYRCSLAHCMCLLLLLWRNLLPCSLIIRFHGNFVYSPYFMEIGLFYYALMLDSLNIRVVLVGLGMVFVCHKLPAILHITPQHPIDKWLRITFIFVCIFLIIQAIFKIQGFYLTPILIIILPAACGLSCNSCTAVLYHFCSTHYCQ